MAWSVESLILFRFILGLGVGADYPICASYVSEFMPKNIRGRMLIGAFSFQAVGIFLAAAIGLLILVLYPNELAWRFMLLVGAIPATIILVARRDIPESARWHIKRGETTDAIRIICKTLHDLPGAMKDCISQFRISHPTINEKPDIPKKKIVIVVTIVEVILGFIPILGLIIGWVISLFLGPYISIMVSRYYSLLYDEGM